MASSLIQRNIPLFIAFRVLFNARWYYPVLAVLFLDLGLTLDQYALLNVVWAVAIVCLEVPSGAVADLIGRHRMVVLAGVLMVLEMILFAFAPMGSPWLFPMLIANRILSGAAEASASGADESLAYDSLKELGREKEWPHVLARLMRWQSAGFFLVMLLGAAIYDPHLVNRIVGFAGLEVSFTAENLMRWPLYLTLMNAIGVLVVTLAMREPDVHQPHKTLTVASAWQQTIDASRWVWQSPKVLWVIVAGLSLDSLIRLFLTVGSKYYRLIEIPEAVFGVLGSSFAVIGFFTSKIMESWAKKYTAKEIFIRCGCLALLGFLFITPFWKIWGVVVILPIGMAMSMTGFFVSHYLNEYVTDSSRRATVLSIKGLAFNLAYGAIGLLFAGFSRLREQAVSQDEIFIEAFRWAPIYFVVTMMGVLWFSSRIKANE